MEQDFKRNAKQKYPRAWKAMGFISPPSVISYRGAPHSTKKLCTKVRTKKKSLKNSLVKVVLVLNRSIIQAIRKLDKCLKLLVLINKINK